jgi:hypothetical protein
MQQNGQADPRLMEMFKRMQLGGNRPQPAMPMGQQVDQFGRPSAAGQFAFDPGQQQRIAQAGLTPDQLAQMTPDQMARFQPMAPVDIDPRTGRPIDAQMQSQIMAQQNFANQAMQGNPGMAAPGGAQISAMNFTPRPATMGLDGMPIQRSNDLQMLAQMQAMQQQGGQGGMPGGQGQLAPNTPPEIQQMLLNKRMQSAGGGMAYTSAPTGGPGGQGGMPGGVPVQRPMPFDPRRPMPVGAGGKGAGAGPRVMETIGNPKGTRPGVPSTMINPPRPMVANNPRAQAAQSANPLLAQMMRGGSR